MRNESITQTTDRPLVWQDYTKLYGMLSLMDFQALMDRGATLNSTYQIS